MDSIIGIAILIGLFVLLAIGFIMPIEYYRGLDACQKANNVYRCHWVAEPGE